MGYERSISASIDVKTVDDHVFDSYLACIKFDAQHNVDLVSGGERAWKIASNVLLRSNDNSPDHYYAIVLYDTEIVRYYVDSTFSVDNGGHNTLTTARRIRQFTPSWFWCNHADKQLSGAGYKRLTHDIRLPVIREEN